MFPNEFTAIALTRPLLTRHRGWKIFNRIESIPLFPILILELILHPTPSETVTACTPGINPNDESVICPLLQMKLKALALLVTVALILPLGCLQVASYFFRLILGFPC